MTVAMPTIKRIRTILITMIHTADPSAISTYPTMTRSRGWMTWTDMATGMMCRDTAIVGARASRQTGRLIATDIGQMITLLGSLGFPMNDGAGLRTTMVVGPTSTKVGTGCLATL